MLLLLLIAIFSLNQSNSSPREVKLVVKSAPQIKSCSLKQIQQDSISTQRAKPTNKGRETVEIPSRSLIINRRAYFQPETKSAISVNSKQAAEPSIRVRKEDYLTKYRASGDNWALVQQPKKDLSHLIFQSNDTIFYASSTTNGWTMAETIGIGKLPCISLDREGKPCISYLSPDNSNLLCAIRDGGTWQRETIFGPEHHGEYEPESIGQPSMLYNINPDSPSNEPMAYLVCSFSSAGATNSFVQFIPFDTMTVFYPSPLDIGLISDELSNPCIGITPEDLLHVVWQRKRDNTRSIYYTVTLEGVTPLLIYESGGNLPWSEKFPITRDFPYTEPASNPFVEAYGDSVFAVWRGPNEGGQEIGEIWRRKRWLSDPYNEWRLPRNWSSSQELESDYPVMSTGEVTAWQELLASNNWEIFLKMREEDPTNVSNTPTPSRYPNITVSLPSPTSGAPIKIYAIWTEEVDPDTFEVKYELILLPDTSSYGYYSVNPGESIPSPYLEERTGYLQYEGYKIDYGRNHLIYRLPYLNPQYDYMARAIVFSAKASRTKQNFVLDDSSIVEIEFEPFKPETLWIKIPEVAYENDLEIRERINRLIGNYAVLADLVLYQYEEEIGGAGEGGAMGDNIGLTLKPILYNCLPNPFCSQTMIRYQLPNQMLVSLKVYDIIGREVKTLVNTLQKAGDYRVRWDGKDSEGKFLSNGVYFYRLKTKDFESIKKTLLIR